MICDAVLTSDSLSWKSGDLWCRSFKLIRKIVGGVDYKVFSCFIYQVHIINPYKDDG